MQQTIAVREAMSTDVVTVKPNSNLRSITRKMMLHKIGCVVVKNTDTIGIVTEGDIVSAISKGRDPEKARAKDVMSTPLISVSPREDVIKVAHLMSKYNIRRLPVMKGKKLLGITTTHDILRVASEESQILSELVDIRLNEIFATGKQSPFSGTCESCGNYADFIQEVDGTFICKECAEEDKA